MDEFCREDKYTYTHMYVNISFLDPVLIFFLSLSLMDRFLKSDPLSWPMASLDNIYLKPKKDSVSLRGEKGGSEVLIFID